MNRKTTLITFDDMSNPARPFHNERIFWDIHASDLEFDAHASMIIERVFDRGDVADIRLCRRFYGDDIITEILLTRAHLSNGRLHLASAIINRPLQAFKCYTSKQLNPKLAPY